MGARFVWVVICGAKDATVLFRGVILSLSYKSGV